jgi:hypothetical protein
MLRYVHGETARRIYENLPLRVQFKLCVAGYEPMVRLVLAESVAQDKFLSAAENDVMERLVLASTVYQQDAYNQRLVGNKLFPPQRDPRRNWMTIAGLSSEDFADIEQAMIHNGYVVGKEEL